MSDNFNLVDIKPKKSKVPIIIVVVLLVFAIVISITGALIIQFCLVDRLIQGIDSVTEIVSGNSDEEIIDEKKSDDLEKSEKSVIKKSENEYNNLGYANPGGRTIQDIADEMDITLEEFLELYSLPEDMPADTEEMVAYYSIPAKVFAEMYGVDFETLKENFGIPDETTPADPKTIKGKVKMLIGKEEIQLIDENTPWGIVLDELTLLNYVGEENLESFKEFYGLGDDVTGETRYKEIRRVVEEKSMQLAAEAKAAEEAQNTEESEQSEQVNDIEADLETTEE